MKKPDTTYLALQQMLINFSLINRAHYLAGTDRHENDIEHSMSVAVLCWYIIDKNKLNLDMSKVFKYAISHDFVEVYAGDTNTFASSTELENKVVRELEALNKISIEFSEFKDMVSSIHNYELKIDEEALFVWTVDKMQQLIMGGMDNWRPYAELPVSYDQFVSKYNKFIDSSSMHCKEIFISLFEYSKSTYYDK